MSVKKVVAGLAVIILASVTVASATTVNNSLVVSGEYNPATGAAITTNTSQIAADIAAGNANVYRIDVNTLLTSVTAGNSFGDTQFDLNLDAGGHLTRVLANVGATVKANWAPNRPAMPAGTQDQNSNPIADDYTGGNNKDAGSSSSDLLAILVAIDNSNIGQLFDSDGNPISDQRQTMAIGSALKLGSFFVKWDGSTTASVATMVNTQYSDYQSSNGQFGTVQNVGNTTSSPVFQAVPEPASMVLLGFGALGLVGFARRRRS